MDLPEGPRITGTLDAWGKEGKGIRIWDYKTGRRGRVPLEIYEEQLRFYAYGMHRAYPECSLDLKLLLLSEGEALSVSLPTSWEEMERSLLEMARQGEEGPFSRIAAKCSACPWRGDFCGGSP